jgi:hypothetical protein
LLSAFCSKRAGGGVLTFPLGRGGIPPTPPFRRALAWAGEVFGDKFYYSLLTYLQRLDKLYINITFPTCRKY